MTTSIAKLVDHALLHPTLTDEDLKKGCEMARELGVATVCVKPYAVPLAVDVLAGSEVGVGTVVGFPTGSATTEIKAHEAKVACRQGATELDMVVNVGKVLSRDWDYVREDIRAVVDVGHQHGAIVKVIFETDYVEEDELKVQLCKICEQVGADFVKTSTGFGFTKQPEGGYSYRGATPHDIRLMRTTCGASVQIKAAGGVRSYEDAIVMRDLGCTRLGSSSSAAIVAGESDQEGY